MPYQIGYRTVYYIGEPEHEKLTNLSTVTGAPVKYADIIANHNASNKFTDPDFLLNDANVDPWRFQTDSANLGVDITHWDRTVIWKRPLEALKLHLVGMARRHAFLPPSAFTETNELKIKLYNDQIADIGICLPQCLGKLVYAVNNPGESFQKSRFDVQQGEVGDCWFISGVAQITVAQELIDIVVPKDNEQNNDSGAYHFRMWKYGVCTDVVIDDYLPLYEPQGPGTGYVCMMGAPKLVKGTNDFEFWGCLVEKAYAKLNGTVAQLAGNQPRYGLEDLTGGISDYMPLTEKAMASMDVFGSLSQMSPLTFVNFYTAAAQGKDVNQAVQYGLAIGHAYSMTKVATVKYNGQDVKLVCLRNPWGKIEWIGPWNENNEDKKAVGLVKNYDGEFWMTWDDVQRYFYQMDLCYWVPEALVEPILKLLAIQQHHSRWSKAEGTNGGWRNPANNPQYVVEIKVDNGYIMASLEAKAQLKDETLCVGLSCYKVANPSNYDLTKPMNYSFFYNHENTELKTIEEEDEIMEEQFLRNILRVSKGWKVPSIGTYIVVPRLWVEDNRDVDFFLRIAGQISNEGKQIQGKPAVVSPSPAPAPTPNPIKWDYAIGDNSLNLDQMDHTNKSLVAGDPKLSNLLRNYGGGHATNFATPVTYFFYK